MGLFSIFKSKKKSAIEENKPSKEKIPIGLKWISVSMVMYFEGTKKEIEKITEDIFRIINNTHSMINYKGELVGHVNPYLGINLASGFTSDNGRVRHITSLYPIVKLPAFTYIMNKPMNKNEMVNLDLSRPYTGIISKLDKDKWKLTFVPIKTNKKDKTNLLTKILIK